jgi:hypothetical protein
MQRLSQTLRTQLGEVQHGDPRALAVRADRLWSVHSTKAGNVAFTDGQEETSPTSISEVRGGGTGCGGQGQGRRGARDAAKVPVATATPGGVPAAEPTPADLARVGSLFLPLDLWRQGYEVRGPLHVGKLDRQGRLNAVIPGSLFHSVHQLSNRCFLIDTGTSYSIFPHHSSATPSGPSLRSAGRSTYSLLGGKDPGFLLAVISFPIIGVDFLRHHQLMVDPQQTQWWTGNVNSALQQCLHRCQHSHQHSHRRPPPKSTASSCTSLLSHRPPQSLASSVTGLLSRRILSHRPLLSSIPVRWPRPQRERTGMHSCWRWSTAVGGFLGSPLEMWSTILTPGDHC